MSQVFDILKPISGTTKLSQLYQIIRDHDQAIRSSFSGAVAPATPVAGQLWEDTANDKLFIYTSAGAWAEVAVANIGLGLEIIASRGSHTSLDARLDAQLNEDGTLKAATTLNPSQWYDLTIASGYVSTTSFKAKGADYTTVYYATRRLKINQVGGAYYTEVASSSYGAPDTTVVTRDAVVGANAAAFRYASHSIVGPRRASFGDGAVSYAMIGNKTVASPTGTYTVLVGDDIVLPDGTFTITGPIAALFGAGRSLIVINIGAGNITYDAYSSETINGSASPFILYPGQSLCIVCDGSNWKRFDQPNSLSVPTIASFLNANHTHAAAGASGGTVTNITGNAITATTANALASGASVPSPVLSGTVTGSYTQAVGTWYALSIPGDWTGYAAYYLKDPMGFVHLRGSATCKSNGGTATWQLFSGSAYYPSYASIFVGLSDSSGVMDVFSIGTNGYVNVIVAQDRMNLWFDGITFKAA